MNIKYIYFVFKEYKTPALTPIRAWCIGGAGTTVPAFIIFFHFFLYFFDPKKKPVRIKIIA